MQPLNPLTLPLQGRWLLEASAGTGKTFTLALLFLRLLLERGLPVDQILVVTFTKAATAELRDRIRLRLQQALDHLDQRSPADASLAALLAALPAAPTRQRLSDALVRMDETAIHTIHSFCQRLLKEQAFAAGLPFASELLENTEGLTLQIMEDFWRLRFYQAPAVQTAWAAQRWTDPQGLWATLKSAATALDCDLIPVVEPEELLALEEASDRLFAQLRQCWAAQHQAVRTLLQEHSCLSRDKRHYHHDQIPGLLADMEQLIGLPEPPWIWPKGLERLSASGLADRVKKKCPDPPSNPLFPLMDQWLTTQTRLMRLRTIQLLTEAKSYMHSEQVRRKRALGLLAYDDLLTELARALERPGSGQRLAVGLAARYPAALIDEFQDTDPVQYRIFSRLYDSQGTVYLIGDPKQAIYSFRGADIFTYIRARRETAPAHRATLGVNHRATPAMVEAINTLFSRCHDAFVFTGDIDFQPVAAAEPAAAAPLVRDGRPLAPLLALPLEADSTAKGGPLSKEAAGHQAVDLVARTLAELLAAAGQGRVHLDSRPLTEGDIAILVRTHTEAEAMQAGLRRHGLRSVAVGQDSVFATPEARFLQLALEAVHDPSRAEACRTALATDLFGLDAAGLQRLRTDERAWETRLASLIRYRQLWAEQGVAAMFQHLVAEEQLTARLTAREGGSRSLANYLHLVELLQASPAGCHGAAALLRWLRRQRQRTDLPEEVQLIRLDDDARLLRIVTIHKAKGLEFPLVVLPFLWAARSLDQDQPLDFHARDSLRRTLDLGSGLEEHRRLAEEELRAEQMRLAYVALTRAKSCCLFCWGRVREVDKTPMARLLHRGATPNTDAQLCAELAAGNQTSPLLALFAAPADTGPVQPAAAALPPLQAAVFTGSLAPGWTITSYSRLSAGTDHADNLDRDEEDSPSLPGPEDFHDIATFPRGPLAGTCLHTLLERIDTRQPVLEQQPLIAQVLDQAGIDPRWLGSTVTWLDNLLAVDLPGACALGGIPPQDRINELDFLFALNEVDLPRCNALLARADVGPISDAKGLQHGLMKGFIDLVFRHQGRYFLVDYKSNVLGPDATHYDQRSLAACMASHQYPLQAMIYILALHRWLGTRLADYRYQQHFGGVYYLFLRALHPNHPPGTGVVFLRPEEELILALDGCLRGEA